MGVGDSIDRIRWGIRVLLLEASFSNFVSQTVFEMPGRKVNTQIDSPVPQEQTEPFAFAQPLLCSRLCVRRLGINEKKRSQGIQKVEETGLETKNCK